MEGERRRTPRYIFFAAAELMEEKSEVRIASRLSELSLRGCYLDMMNPFPVGTSILLKVWTDESTVFQSNARVIYSQPNVGAGAPGVVTGFAGLRVEAGDGLVRRPRLVLRHA